MQVKASYPAWHTAGAYYCIPLPHPGPVVKGTARRPMFSPQVCGAWASPLSPFCASDPLTAHWEYNPMVSKAPSTSDSQGGGSAPLPGAPSPPPLSPPTGTFVPHPQSAGRGRVKDRRVRTRWGSCSKTQSAQRHTAAGPLLVISWGVSFLGSKLG